eukprot:Pgem_evm1s12473
MFFFFPETNLDLTGENDLNTAAYFEHLVAIAIMILVAVFFINIRQAELKRLKGAYAMADQASKAKDFFLASSAHE